MPLTLEFAERELLIELLEEQQRNLLREIARADHYEFRAVLRDTEELLESILDKLRVEHGQQWSAPSRVA